LGELVRSRSRRSLDIGVWLALAAGLAPLAFYVPLIRSALTGMHGYWTPPEWGFIRDSYEGVLGGALIVVLLWLWTAVARTRQVERHPDSVEQPAGLAWPAHEAVACLALVLMPLTIGVAAQLFSLQFYKYYVQPVVIGCSILLALFSHWVGSGSPQLRRATAALLVWAGLLPWGLLQFYSFAALPKPAALVMAPFKSLLDTTLPVVVDNNDRFLALTHYAPPRLAQRLYALSNDDAAIRFLGSNTALRNLDLMNRIRPLNVANYRDFSLTHAEFLLVLTNPESWVVQQLLADGFDVRLQRYEKNPGAFSAELFIFYVQPPPLAARR
jgi:hypothetical protein